ncbi:MAG TPA: TonB family protein [Bacteroidales bacterium]|nr:energy transducer TonB [Bacteroidales bacterium]HNZ43346.1 TonB family protein [Bacteroidales bacterium]HPI30188.1 TonB family protein [Bacteroidales bacterium]
MKTSVNYLEDFIFQHRNKEYGAYVLRKTYLKTLIVSVIMGTGIFLTGVSGVWVADYFKKSTTSHEQKQLSVMLSTAPKKQEVVEIPELPKAEKQKTVTFRPPVVVFTEEEITEELSDIMDKTENISPLDTAAAKETIVEIKEDTRKTTVIEEEEEMIIHTFVEEYPQFPGGESERLKYLNENLKYPQVAKESNIQGAVYITFVVERDGSITNVAVLRGIGGGCDEEALRVISTMPKWNPGRQNGKEVRVQFNMPITFKLM